MIWNKGFSCRVWPVDQVAVIIRHYVPQIEQRFTRVALLRCMRMCEYQERALVEQAERALLTDSPPVTAPQPMTIGVQGWTQASSGESETQRLRHQEKIKHKMGKVANLTIERQEFGVWITKDMT